LRFSFYADVSTTPRKVFSQNVDVPLLRAEVVRYFSKQIVAVIHTLSALDLLNKNVSASRGLA
jgi:hypothetical protein